VIAIPSRGQLLSFSCFRVSAYRNKEHCLGMFAMRVCTLIP
jgi:hypothetical protein